MESLELFFGKVVGVRDGIEALDEAKSNLYDVIMLDISIPHMDGLECIEKLVTMAPEVRILVVSALSDKATGIKALELGASGFLCKPFSEEELAEAMSELVSD